jgi:hypothetical protein
MATMLSRFMMFSSPGHLRDYADADGIRETII